MSSSSWKHFPHGAEDQIIAVIAGDRIELGPGASLTLQEQQVVLSLVQNSFTDLVRSFPRAIRLITS